MQLKKACKTSKSITYDLWYKYQYKYYMCLSQLNLIELKTFWLRFCFNPTEVLAEWQTAGSFEPARTMVIRKKDFNKTIDSACLLFRTKTSPLVFETVVEIAFCL